MYYAIGVSVPSLHRESTDSLIMSYSELKGLFPHVRITKYADFAYIYIPAVFKGAFTVMSNGV